MPALHAISNIELRGWPEGAPLYIFHKSFKSDIALVKAFCRDRRRFGRSSRAMVDRWYPMALISKPVLAYFLPAVLLSIPVPSYRASERKGVAYAAGLLEGSG